MSNSPFPTKQTELARSHLDLNLHFNGLAKWDAAAIIARTALLGEKVLKEWPRPTSEIAYEASSEALAEPEGLSSGAKQRLEYWRHLDTRLEERGMPRDEIKPATDSSISIPIGTSGSMELVLSQNQQRGAIYVSLVLSGKAGEKVGRGLEREKEAVEQELGYRAVWEINNSGGEIFAADEGIPIRDRNDWPVQHDWFGDRLEDFKRVLAPRAVRLEAEALQDPALRQSVEQREQLAAYWAACRQALSGSALLFGRMTLAMAAATVASNSSKVASISARNIMRRMLPFAFISASTTLRSESHVPWPRSWVKTMFTIWTHNWARNCTGQIPTSRSRSRRKSMTGPTGLGSTSGSVILPKNSLRPLSHALASIHESPHARKYASLVFGLGTGLSPQTISPNTRKSFAFPASASLRSCLSGIARPSAAQNAGPWWPSRRCTSSCAIT
jgi:hypothetical protein